MPQRVNRGQAEAVFQATPTGGQAIANHDFKGLGAPSDRDLRATIRPIAEEGFDGRHYCAEDWHVIVLTDRAIGDQDFSRPDFEALTANDEIIFSLDGELLETSRTATRRLILPSMSEDERAWAFQEGVVLAPDQLGVGQHRLTATVTTPPDPTFELAITFHIDAPGTGECL
jgi:hypothetical protein